ncbi:MAG TPA: hypothetical protein VMZ05_08910, partial [Spirochaetota bacterium]|nr:hypothetical protein [Spirochaetota bacterium]
MKDSAVDISGKFSRDLKIDKIRFLSGERIESGSTAYYLQQIEKVDPESLTDDDSRKAFWINLYNGFTNFLIIKKRIKRSILRRVL